jgi:hypothetical protein
VVGPERTIGARRAPKIPVPAAQGEVMRVFGPVQAAARDGTPAGTKTVRINAEAGEQRFPARLPNRPRWKP